MVDMMMSCFKCSSGSCLINLSVCRLMSPYCAPIESQKPSLIPSQTALPSVPLSHTIIVSMLWLLFCSASPRSSHKTINTILITWK